MNNPFQTTEIVEEKFGTYSIGIWSGVCEIIFVFNEVRDEQFLSFFIK